MPIPKRMIPAVMGHKKLADDMLQWRLNDNAASTDVLGEVTATLAGGGNTSDIAAAVDGKPALHLNGTSHYISVQVPKLWPSSFVSIFTKRASPVIDADASHDISFGQLVAKPGGGWYYYAAYSLHGDPDWVSIMRYESTDLITWTNRIEALHCASAGAWDTHLMVASVFQRASDGLWMMLYRGYDGTTYRIGLATSSDGATFTRKNNGGVNDGLFAQFGTNFDPTAVILVGSRYYVWVNGEGGNHGWQNIYYSDDDFNTFTAAANNPIFTSARDSFCAGAWKDGTNYYALVCMDINSGETLNNHVMRLYRSTSPLFEVANRTFLGYVMTNDGDWDAGYLDTPTVPMTDVTKASYPAEFGDTLNVLYTGYGKVALSHNRYTELLATASYQTVRSLPPKMERFIDGPYSISLNVQFDTITNGDPLLSISNAYNDGGPHLLAKMGSGNKLTLFLGGDYRYTTPALAINTPYQIVITYDLTHTIVYINGALAGDFTQAPTTPYHGDYLYVGSGYGGRFLDGSVWDLRVYPKCLTADEAGKLYLRGSTR